MPEDSASDADDEPSLAERFKAVEDDFTAKIADVRQRIVQIKMEIDEKAPADHDHDALEGRLDDLEAAVEALDPVDPETVAQLETDVEQNADAVDSVSEDAAGLGEDIEDLRGKVGMLASASVDVQDRLDELEPTLTAHDDSIEDIEEKLDVVASSSLDVQDRLEALTGRAEERDALGRLREAANREGVRRARCGACQTRLDVGLLSSPTCPDCGATFVDVESGGLLRRGRLVTESRPGVGASEASGDDDADGGGVVPGGVEDRPA